MAKVQETDHPQVLKLVEKEDVEGLIAVLKTSGSPAVLKHAILFLGGHKEKKAIEPLIALLQSEFALPNGNSGILREVVEALGEIGDGAKTATVPLLKIINTTANADYHSFNLRETILAALAKIRDPNAVEPLIKFINDDASSEDVDYAFQNSIIIVLGDIGDNRAVEPLIRLMLRNSDVRIKGTAAAALGKIGDNRGIKPLIAVLENEKEHEFVKDNAAWSLFKFEDGELALPLLRYLKRYQTDILGLLNTVGNCSFIPASK